MILASLTDDELLRHAYVQRDPLTSTELERELIRRFEDHAAEASASREFREVAEEHDCDTPEDLRTRLEASGQVRNFSALAELIEALDEDGIALLRTVAGRAESMFDDPTP